MKERAQNSHFSLNILKIILFITPILFFPLSFDYFITPKWTFFNLSLILLVGSLLFSLRKGEKIKFYPSPFILPLSLLLFFSLLSFFKSINLYDSLSALSILISGFIFYFLALSFEPKKLISLLKPISLISLLISIYGIIQWLGFCPLGTGEFQFTPFSTLGRRNFTSEYIVSVLPLTFLFTIQARSLRERILFSFTLFSSLFLLIITYTRASYLAFFFSISFFLFFYWREKGFSLKPKRVALLFSLLFLVPLLLNFSFGSRGSSSRFTAGSVQSRLSIYKGAIKMFTKSPVLGVGIGNFQNEFPLYTNRWLLKRHRGKIEVIHTHNEYLQVLSETGMPGFLALLYFLISMGYLFFSVYPKAGKEKFIILALSSSLLAILVNSLFSFPLHIPTTFIYFWFFISLLTTCAAKIRGKEPLAFSLSSKSPLRSLLPILYPVLLFFFFYSLFPFIGSIYLRKAYISEKEWNLNQAAKSILKAEFYQPRDKNLLLIAGRIFLKIDETEEAQRVCEKFISLSPFLPVGYAHLGTVYLKKEDFPRAEALFKKSLQLDPYQKQVYNNLKVLYHLSGRDKEAKEIERKIIELNLN